MREYNIAVTGLNAAEAPASGISVIRCLKSDSRNLKDAKVRITALVYELLCSASYMQDLIDEVYYVPFPQNNEAQFLARIAEITSKKKIDMLIPNLDFEISIMSRLAGRLRKLGIRMLIPPQDSLFSSRKENLIYLTHTKDFYLPYTIVFSDRRQITESAAHFTYPLIIKAANGEASIVYSLEEAIVFSNRLLSLWGTPLIMQQFIRGEEYCVASLSDSKAKVIASVSMKKVLKSRNGTAWMALTTKEDSLSRISKKIIEKLKWVGPIELEFIKEEASGRYYLIEINPRYPTWIELAAKAGCNLPWASLELILEKKVAKCQDYKSGILFSRSAMDILCGITRLGKLATEKELIYCEEKICR